MSKIKGVVKKGIFYVLDKLLDFFFCLNALVDKNGNNLKTRIAKKYLNKHDAILVIRDKNLFPSRYFIPSRIESNSKSGELAIVIQGPIEERDNFTLETIKFYKKLFTGAIIIVSTWDTTNKKLLQRFKEEGCVIVLSKVFENNGLRNVNYQICTTFAGIKKAKELGARFVMKTRSDLRIYREFSFEYLKTLLEKFPISETNVMKSPMGRIITLAGFSGQMCAVNWFQDFMYFGYTDDLFCMFDINYDDRKVKNGDSYFIDKYNGKWSKADVCNEFPPEVYITTKYLLKFSHCEMTVESTLENFKKYFFVIDFDSIGAIWYKYGKYTLWAEMDSIYNIPDFAKNYNSLFSYALLTDKLVIGNWLEEERSRIIFTKEQKKFN